jgi:hypothetical protein
VSSKARFARLAICALLILLTVCADSPLLANNAPQENQQSSSSRQVVVLLDVNPNQQKVFSLESDLAMGVLDHLNEPDDAVSLITFGSEAPVLGIVDAKPSDAIDAIKKVSPEQPGERDFSVHLYKAIDLALNQFADDARPKSLLIIAEGREDFGGKAFKQIVSRARQLRVNCYVALVARHSLRGSKSILIYGFYLSELARKTHGRCIEVGDRPKKVPRSIDRLSESILGEYSARQANRKPNWPVGSSRLWHRKSKALASQ